MVYECDAIDTFGIVPSEYHINVLLFQQFPEFLFRFCVTHGPYDLAGYGRSPSAFLEVLCMP